MADEIPPAPSESDDVTKSETIRITLPPKSEQPAVKRETVRINVPGKPVAPAGAVAPKKETTKLPTVGAAPSAPGGAAKPFVPPPPAPKPPGAPGAPGAPSAPPMRPAGAGAPPPKPPGLGAKPTVPLKPAGAPGAPGAPEPVTQRAAAPKKETARITLPAEGAKAPLPKATVKMQQTQPLVNRPAPSLTPAAPMSVAPAMAGGDAEADPMVTPLSIAAVVLSLVALIFTYLAYSAASVS